MAKRTRSIRSTSNDSKIGATDAPGADLMQKEEYNGILQAKKLEHKSYLPIAPVSAPSVHFKEPPVERTESLGKTTSFELEDLLAEGRAAASLALTANGPVPLVMEQRASRCVVQEHCDRRMSEPGETQDESSRHEQPAFDIQSLTRSEHFPANEVDDIDTWLAMTGYYDKAYRGKVLSRRRRLKEIEEERMRLLEEEQEDQRLRGPFNGLTPFLAIQRTKPPATTCPSPLALKQDVGLRIKDTAIKPSIAPEKNTSNGDAPVKRGMDEETADAPALHKPKAARTEVHHRTPPRSQRPSPERRHNRSASPRSNNPNVVQPRRRQSPPFKDGCDRWLPDRDTDSTGAIDRSAEGCTWRRDYQGRTEQRHDPGFSTSLMSKPDLGTERTRFFLLKSWNYENIATAQREGTWATQTKNEDIFVEAFKTCRNVIFFFSANHSKAFQGYARMQGLPGETGVEQPSWVKNLHWPTTEPFRIRWIVKEETSYRAVGNLKNPLNENLPIFVGRDGQEIPEKLGLQVCDIIDEDIAYQTESRR